MRRGRIQWETGSSRSMPRDLHEQAARRLAFVSLVAVVLAIVSWAASGLRIENIGPRAGTVRPTWTFPVGLALSLAMTAVARSNRISIERRLDIGLIYAVAMSFLWGFFRHALPYVPSDVLRGVSMVVPAMLFFAVVVPVPPDRMVVASIAAALVDPLTLWITVQRGAPMPPPNLWLWLFLPNAVAVFLVVITSRMVWDLGQEVKKARELGSYRLHERIGAGGMGEVWRAEHQMLARPAAIKLIREVGIGGADASTLERFEREARATAALTSAHTIEVYDFGVTDDGAFYYVMELLEGRDLASILAGGATLPPARAVHLLRGVCHSLRDAHHAGLIHRDIKPANLFVCEKGGEHDFVKVLDFGLVKSFTHDGETAQTIAGAVGTPGYMAPETLRGEPQGPGADIYAVGCVAYRMLTGREVFDAGDLLPTLLAHAERAPEPVDRAAPQPIPAPLAAWVMRCLEKRPEARHESVATMLGELDAMAVELPWTEADAANAWAASSLEASSSAAEELRLGEADTVAMATERLA